jgi:hypothetical protein
MKSILLPTVALLMGCASVSPQQNFVNFLEYSLGSNINEKINYDVGWRGHQRESVLLENGNRLNTYLYKNPYGECLYSFEVDSNGKILNWNIIGDRSACRINP